LCHEHAAADLQRQQADKNLREGYWVLVNDPKAVGSGAGLRRTALDVLQHQRQTQRYGRVGRTGCADGGLRELLRDVAPGRSRPAIFRQKARLTLEARALTPAGLLRVP
jgi:hypothetical protein